MSKKQLSNQIKSLKERKEQLMKLRATGPLSEQNQAELDEITDKLFDLEEQLENFGKEPESKSAEETEQKPAEETEQTSEAAAPVTEQKPAQHKNALRLKIQVGNRFSAATGEEINPPFEQTYTRSEWNNFKQHHTKCGYKVVKVVHDPWGEASQMFDTNKK